MKGKVAIIGYGQSHHQFDINRTREDMVFDVVKEALKSAGISRADIGTVVTASSDFLDGRTISNVFLSMAVGAYLKDESKVEEDGTNALYYGMMKILTGAYDIALVEAHTMAWTFNPHQVWFYTLDPLVERQMGFDDICLSALQARMYMEKYGVSEKTLAKVAVKSLSNALKNPYAYRKLKKITVEQVLKSKRYYEPLTDLMISPLTDGCAVVILASEKKAKEVCEKPVWIQGIGTYQEDYLRDRDLLKLNSLKKAVKTAYNMAGIKNPRRDLDVLELSARFAHEELMIYEALGLCKEGEGAKLLEKGITARNGKLPVNPSGGALSADPICATGLIRVIEAVRQIKGEANGYQVKGAKRALAHGQFGICAQKNTVVILGGER